MTQGRPRAFDGETALEQALLAFWQHGYDATSITVLTEAMGINASSLYAAFGDKRSLFTAAVRRYLQGPARFTTMALEGAPTAREAVERLLRAAAVTYTAPGHPPGCLVISAATNCTPGSLDVQAELRDIRAQGRQALTQRITAGIVAREMPPETDAHALAAFYAATLQGMSGLARDGSTHAELDHVATAALAAWPG
ncbi:TetR/AcrR family transcriptional regulator [Frankia gtarii]|uniref:TetR/AcrR family transcriptional regulator n=1 Tax=Frankia gtarii TaxID=2950102 RepID=UPI0021C11515|nr:TetR/AcrR family transcriptional regulator [Frankia gtarii]